MIEFTDDYVEPDPMNELFLAEAREQLRIVRSSCDQLERGVGLPALLAEELAPAAHTLRGAARIVGRADVAEIAIEMEQLFSRFLKANAATASDRNAVISLCDKVLSLLDSEAPSPAIPLVEIPVPQAPPPEPVQAEVTEPIWVQTFDASFLELFREEVRTHCQALADGLLELERDATNPQKIEPLMRAAHSLKGACRIVGLDLAVQLAHEMEDVFVNAQAGKFRLDSSSIEVLLNASDSLGPLATESPEIWLKSRGKLLHMQIRDCATLARGEKISAKTIEKKLAEPPIIKAPIRPANVVEITTTPEPEGGVVRVTAQSLNRLMSLAGESLVQARWLQLFASALLEFKKQHDRISMQLDQISQGFLDARPMDSLAYSVSQTCKEAVRARQMLVDRVSEFEDHAGQAEDLNSRLYREVILSRMRPFSDGGQGFPRLVRDTAKFLAKQVRLDVVGQHTEVDRDILEKLEAPLMHLLRNSIDHGIELPEVRERLGKPREGIIRIEARHRGGMLSISIGDDGGGIDVERIRNRVVARNMTTPEMAARLTTPELLEFLFLPGFTTANSVTEISGRGVGLDVVQETLRRVGGSVHITTKVGEGTSFHLLLPLTLSVVRAVLVTIAGEPYAFPHTRIDRLVRVPRRDIRSVEHCQFATLDGQNVGLVYASQILELPPIELTAEDLFVVLLRDNTGVYGLIVDRFRGEQDLVVRPLDTRLGKVHNITAAAILDDGSPVLIADVEDMIRSMDPFIQSGTLRRYEQSATVKSAKRILIVDDSITVREVQRQILRTNGYEPDVAVDGQDGWNKVRNTKYDLVISDVDMPRMTGLEFVKRIRDDDHLSALPVIIVSYKDRESDRVRGLEVGANAYLTKGSFHDSSYLDAIAALIGPAR